MTNNKNQIKGYKVFTKDWKGFYGNFQYKLGETFTHNEEILLCKSGFHFCKNLADCFNYTSFNNENRVIEILALGKVIGSDNNKFITDKIKIIRELSWFEVLELCNSGNRNSGNRNSGDYNSGDYNSGDRNSGDYNSGNRNSGYRNSGYCNSGNYNSGNYNSGYYNSGGHNSGNYNSGNCNSGNYNSGNYNSGYCNSITPEDILVFNKICKRENWKKAIKPQWMNVELSKWIYKDDMSEKEKEAFPSYVTTGGYLKIYESLVHAYIESWENAFIDDRELTLKLPNFDDKVFKEIFGFSAINNLSI